MNNRSRLEFLPNEILTDIFEYFNAPDLFRAFYHLNLRLNTLLQTLNNLCLTLRTIDPHKNNDYKICTPYIRNLKLNGAYDINLNDFTNLRHLHLLDYSGEQRSQLETNIYPYLEHLSINYRKNFTNNSCNLWEKILTNSFPHLLSCELFESRLLNLDTHSIQPTQLKSIKMNIIDFSSYQIILSACPILNLFQFSIYAQQEELCLIKPHLKLKTMIIKFLGFGRACDDSSIENYLICVPSLEQLIIYVMDNAPYIDEYCNYQWLKLSIDRYLLSLSQLIFYLSIIYSDQSSKDENKKILNKIKNNFKQIHNDRYCSELHIDLSTLLYFKNARYYRAYELKRH